MATFFLNKITAAHATLAIVLIIRNYVNCFLDCQPMYCIRKMYKRFSNSLSLQSHHVRHFVSILWKHSATGMGSNTADRVEKIILVTSYCFYMNHHQYLGVIFCTVILHKSVSESSLWPFFVAQDSSKRESKSKTRVESICLKRDEIALCWITGQNALV